jgi:hypothetical protein
MRTVVTQTLLTLAEPSTVNAPAAPTTRSCAVVVRVSLVTSSGRRVANAPDHLRSRYRRACVASESSSSR